MGFSPLLLISFAVLPSGMAALIRDNTVAAGVTLNFFAI